MDTSLLTWSNFGTLDSRFTQPEYCSSPISLALDTLVNIFLIAMTCTPSQQLSTTFIPCSWIGSAAQVIQEGASASSCITASIVSINVPLLDVDFNCFPNNWDTISGYYYSASNCPNGFTRACTGYPSSISTLDYTSNYNYILDGPFSSGESFVDCCMTGFQCDTFIHNRCLSTQALRQIVAGIELDSNCGATTSEFHQSVQYTLTHERVHLLFDGISQTSQPSRNASSISPGKIAGIIVGGVIAIISLVLAPFLMLRWKRKQKTSSISVLQGDLPSSHEKPELSGSATIRHELEGHDEPYNQVDGYEIRELDSGDYRMAELTGSEALLPELSYSSP